MNPLVRYCSSNDSLTHSRPFPDLSSFSRFNACGLRSEAIRPTFFCQRVVRMKTAYQGTRLPNLDFVETGGKQNINNKNGL
jgi:hypothetical protein